MLLWSFTTQKVYMLEHPNSTQIKIKKILGNEVWWPKCIFLWFYIQYNIYTPCIFTFMLAYMTSMEYKLSKIYDFMDLRCTHYKLCPLESKLVHFSQFLGMKHFLGPVCDIWTYLTISVLLSTKGFFLSTFVKCVYTSVFVCFRILRCLKLW